MRNLHLLTTQASPTSVTSQHQFRLKVPRVGQCLAIEITPASSILSIQIDQDEVSFSIFLD